MASEDGVKVLEGADQPVAQQARAHGSAGGVERLKQGGRGIRAGGAAGGDEVQIEEGGLVEHHGIGGGPEADAADMVGRAAEVAGDVVEQGPGGGCGGGVILAAEAREGLNTKVAAEAINRGRWIEDPVFAGGDGERADCLQGGQKPGVGVEGFGEDDFRGGVAGEVVEQGIRVG